MNKKLGLVTGSFDPITAGHVDIIRRAAKLFDKVTVVVADNEEKNYLFSREERLEIARAAVSDFDNVSVEYCSGFVADFAKEHGASAFVRGIRGEDDVAYEQNMAGINLKNSGVDTVLLFSKPEYNHISSTKVREIIKKGESLAGFMCERSAKKAENYYNLSFTKNSTKL